MAEALPEGAAEMRNAFKAAVKCNFTDGFARSIQQQPRMLQTPVQQPAPGRRFELLLEVALECRQTPAAEAGVIRDSKIAQKILFHDLSQRITPRAMHQGMEVSGEVFVLRVGCD